MAVQCERCLALHVRDEFTRPIPRCRRVQPLIWRFERCTSRADIVFR